MNPHSSRLKVDKNEITRGRRHLAIILVTERTAKLTKLCNDLCDQIAADFNASMDKIPQEVLDLPLGQFMEEYNGSLDEYFAREAQDKENAKPKRRKKEVPADKSDKSDNVTMTTRGMSKRGGEASVVSTPVKPRVTRSVSTSKKAKARTDTLFDLYNDSRVSVSGHVRESLSTLFLMDSNTDPAVSATDLLNKTGEASRKEVMDHVKSVRDQLDSLLASLAE